MKIFLIKTLTKNKINNKIKEVRPLQDRYMLLNTHSLVMTASHNYILSEIEALKKCTRFKVNNTVSEICHIFFCLNFG